MEDEENDTVAAPNPAHWNTGGSGLFGGDAAADSHQSDPSSYPAQYNFNRRTSVSAESLKPGADSSSDNWTPPFTEKTPAGRPP